jgi:Lon protease-like protein
VDRYRGVCERLGAIGRVPIFPLPDLVFFPHALLPLHIFEPRYRRMVSESLAGDRVIAMALLKPGWEGSYEGSPEVHPVACAGIVEDEARLPDGRFNIRLRGVTRIEILRFVQDAPYRVAEVRLLPDLNETGGPGAEAESRRLLTVCAGLLQEMSGNPARLLTLDAELPFAILVNTLCQSLDLPTDAKQRLLETGDVVMRCRALIDLLEGRWKEAALRRSESGGRPGEKVH